MPTLLSKTVYFIEAHQRTHDGTGRWGGWFFVDWFRDFRAARRERDRLNDESDSRVWQCRIVAYSRGRVYKKGSTEDAVL